MMLASIAEREQFRSLSAAKIQKFLELLCDSPHLFNNIKAKRAKMLCFVISARLNSHSSLLKILLINSRSSGVRSCSLSVFTMWRVPCLYFWKWAVWMWCW